MRINIKRDKEVRINQKGQVENVSWRLSFNLEPTPAETAVIEEHNLTGEIIHVNNGDRAVPGAGYFRWQARHMLGVWVRVPNAVDLMWADTLSSRIVEECKQFEQLVSKASTFEGVVQIDLSGLIDAAKADLSAS